MTQARDLADSNFTSIGGLQLGGTGAANLLDDYEEGTWTPTSVVGLTSLSVTAANYTKIGNLVFAGCRIVVLASAASGVIEIGGLPFTSTSIGSGNVGQGNTNFDFEGGSVQTSTTTFKISHNFGTSGSRTISASVLYQTS